jgi:hypothetical protein
MGLLEFQSSPSAIAGRNGLSLMPPYQGFDSGLPRYSVVDTPEHDLSLRRSEAPHGGGASQPRCSYPTNDFSGNASLSTHASLTPA